jgi:metallo-beta-lactamase family protein
MRITFHGAAREVTGSLHLLEVNGQKILLECGMYQGHREDTYTRNLNFPFDPASIDTMVLSHAHIDHSGNLPNLVKKGFKGNVWCTAATRNLSTYMLQDAGHIQEADVEFVNKRRKREGLAPVEPLYTRADAVRSLEHLVAVGFHRPVPVADGVQITYYTAAHILGSAFVALDVDDREAGRKLRVVFSGDVGREELAILMPPEKPDVADVVIMESTYGDRLHGPMIEARRELRDVIRDTIRRRGKIIIPAFAVGRTQEIVYGLNEMQADGDLPMIPVFIDSPLAVSATEVFRMHPEEWDAEVREFLKEERRPSPFDAPNIEYVRDVSRSKQLNFINGPAIIISASGMAESGRIQHHIKNNIEDEENLILFVSYQAENTLGRKLVDGAKVIRVFGDEYRVRARVGTIDGYSSHADQKELLAWVSDLDRSRTREVFLVHGEPTAAFTLAEKLREDGFAKVTVPERGDSFEL